MEYQIVQCYMKYKNLCEFYVKFTNFTFPFVYLSIENAKYMIESNIS